MSFITTVTTLTSLHVDKGLRDEVDRVNYISSKNNLSKVHLGEF